MLSTILLSAVLAQSAPATAPSEPSPTPAAVPGPAGLEVIWSSSWDEAVEAAHKIPNGRVLVYFGDDDCGQCRRMEALIWPSTSFFAFTRDKVPVYEKFSGPEGKKLAATLRVKEIPAWVVVTPELLVSGRQVGPTSQMGWVQAFVEAEKGWYRYRKLRDDEKANPGDPRLVFDVALESFHRNGDSVAESRFQRLGSDPKTPPDLREQSLAYLATIQLDSERPEDAGKSLDQLLSIAKEPRIRQRAELRRADVDIALGRKDLAAARLRAFKKEWPDSPALPEVDRLLDAISPTATKDADAPR
ncbi:MAG: hypothetical protein ACHQPI_03090 [Thermoanaerobaculia bacterium]